MYDAWFASDFPENHLLASSRRLQ